MFSSQYNHVTCLLAQAQGTRSRSIDMAPLVDGWDYGSWSAVYNALSFGPRARWIRAFSLLISARLNFSIGHFSESFPFLPGAFRVDHICYLSSRSLFLISRRTGIAGMGSATIFFWSRSARLRSSSRDRVHAIGMRFK